MKATNSILLSTFIILSVACSQNGSSDTTQLETKSITKNNEPNFSESEIAKYAIASIMNQSPEIIDVKNNGKSCNVSYTRTDDGKKFNYKIRIRGYKIIWGNVDGRWRDKEYDEKISYQGNGDELEIIQTFSDGSKSKQTFVR